MDRRALERLGHHVVSRRVALGYRNRTDLADSLQFTVRTLADIEHGVRKASPGTYAMLENKLAWARAASTPSWPAGNPELVSNCAATTPPPSQDTRCADQPPTPCRSASTEELLLELRRRIIAPRDDATTLGRLGRRPRPTRRLARTGLAASTGPNPCPTLMRFAAPFAFDTVPAASSVCCFSHALAVGPLGRGVQQPGP